MKIDLTNLPPDQQLALVILHLGKKLAGRHPSDRTLFASDLLGKFKHRGLATHQARLEFFSRLQRAAVELVIAKGQQDKKAPPIEHVPTT